MSGDSNRYARLRPKGSSTIVGSLNPVARALAVAPVPFGLRFPMKSVTRALSASPSRARHHLARMPEIAGTTDEPGITQTSLSLA